MSLHLAIVRHRLAVIADNAQFRAITHPALAKLAIELRSLFESFVVRRRRRSNATGSFGHAPDLSGGDAEALEILH